MVGKKEMGLWVCPVGQLNNYSCSRRGLSLGRPFRNIMHPVVWNRCQGVLKYVRRWLEYLNMRDSKLTRVFYGPGSVMGGTQNFWKGRNWLKGCWPARKYLLVKWKETNQDDVLGSLPDVRLHRVAASMPDLCTALECATPQSRQQVPPMLSGENGPTGHQLLMAVES